MWGAISRWRQRRILRRAAIPDALWREATALRPFLAIYDDSELERLREKVVLFLHAKGIVGARGHEVTPLQRVVIAIEACVLVLELDLAYYDGFENVIVYPGEFVPDWEWEDEAGVVHRNDGPLAGRGDARRAGGAVVARCRRRRRLGEHRHEPRDPRVRAQDRHAQRRSGRLSAAARRHVAGRLAEDADGGVRRLLRARRRWGGHDDRPLRGREPGRVLRRALRGVLRRPVAAARASIRGCTSNVPRSTGRIPRRVRRAAWNRRARRGVGAGEVAVVRHRGASCSAG